MARKTSSLADTAAQFVSAIAGRGCYLVLQVFLARSLGPREFGLYAIGWTVAGLVGTLAPIGMPQAILRYGIAGRRALHAAPMPVVTLAGLVSFAAILATAAPLAGRVFGEPDAEAVIIAFAPSVPLTGILGVLLSALRVSHANLASAGAGSLVFALYLAAVLLAFHSGTSPVVAAHMYTAALALTLLPSAWLLYIKPPASDEPGLRHLIRFGIVTMFISGSNVLNLWADRIVIGVMADARAIGLYQVASQLAMVVIVLRSAVVSVFEARVPKLAKADGTVPNVTREFIAATRILLHASAPGLVVLTLTASFWTTTLFGPDYAGAAMPLVVLAVGQLGLTFAGPSVNALHMTGEEHTVMRLTAGTCLLNLLGNIGLIPLLGLAGAAAASVAANLIVSLTCLARLRSTGRLRLPAVALGDIAVATATCATVTLLLVHASGSLSFGAVIGILVTAYAVYGAIITCVCRVEDEAVDLTRATFRRVFGLRPRPPPAERRV